MSPQKEKTVLLVEDDAIIALASAQTIRRFGYEVIIAHSGEKAIELVNEEELIDLILMDIDLGNGISGPEAASHILEYRSIPIVFLTSHAEREMVDKVRGITRYGYVIKNAGDFVLQSSIEMAFELFDANEKTKNELSERKRTEEVLKSSLALLEATLESTDNGILVVSTEGRVLKVNGRFSEMWRIPDDILDSGEDEELLNHILNQLSDPEEFLAKVRKLYDERAAESFDLVHFKDGRTFERISKPMLVGEEPKGRAWSFSDITERKRAEEELRESEKKHDELITLMRLMSDTMPDLLWAKDLEKRFIFANKAVCEKLLQAADTAEPIGKGDLFFAQRQRDSHPEDPQWYTFGELCMDSDAITLKEMREMQFDEYGNTNGKFLYLDVHKAPLFSDEGKLIGVVGSARDITERKKTEQALRESEERHRSILNASPDVITITDLEGHVLMVSPLATEMFGCDRQEELLGHLVTDFLVPEDRERAMSNVALMFQGVMTGPSGYRGLRKDGKKLDMDVNGEFIRSMDGQPTHMVFVLRDITERKQAEEALSRSRERFRLLHEHAPIGILLVTVSGQILEVNPAALHILGSPSVEATKGINIVTFPLLVEAGISAAFQRCVETAQAGFGEYPYVSKWGKPIHMQLRYVPILGDHGSVSLVHVIIEDTTERKRMEEELVNERSLLRNVIDNLPEPIYVKDMQGRKILANLAEAHWSGRETVEEVLGKTDAELYSAEIATHSKFEEDEIRATGRSLINHEANFVALDGKLHWLIGAKILLRDAKGIPTGILGITHDITERKRSENVLREKEEQYQALVELSPDGIAVHSDGILRFINPAGARLLGASSPQELIGKPITEFIAPAHRPSAAARIHNVLTSREKFPPEDGKFLRLDGSEVDTEVTSSAFNYEGKPSILALIRDSTERKRVEKALQESKEIFRTIIETSPDAIGVFDNNAIITMMNAAAAVSFGYAAPEEMVGLNALEFFMPQDHEKAMGVIQNIMTGGTVRNAEFKLLKKDGNSFDAEFNASALYNGKDGEPTGIIAITRDVTERKRIAELLHQSHQNFETFFNTIDEFLFVLDERGNIVHTNTTVNERLGYSSGELLGKSVLTVHPTERREEAGRIVGEMLNGAAVFCPVPIVTKSGVQIPVETRVKLGIWDGKPAIFGVTKDISRIALSEEKFSKVFYLNPSACGLSDLDDHKYVEVNEAFYTLLGFDKDEVLGRTATELGILSPETINAVVQKADRNGKIANAEADLRSKNGDVKHVLLSAEDIHVQDKKYRFTMVYDISERKRAEEALKDSEMRFRLLAENSIEMISRHTPDGAYIYASPACRTLLGYEAEELIGHSSFEFIHPDDLAGIEKSRLTVLEAPKTDVVTYRLRRKDGTYFWVESTSHSLKDKESGETVEIQVSSREITRRREAEDKLRDSEARYRVLFDKAMDGIIIIGADGQIVDMNESFATMHGYHLDEMMKKSLRDISTPENAEAIKKRMEHVLSGESLHFEVSHYHKDGRTFSLDAVANGVELGGKRYVVSIHRDLSERKKDEESIKKLLQEKELLLHEVHHRIKNNMSMMMSLLTLQADVTKSATVAAALHDAGDRMRSMMVLYDKLYRSQNVGEVSVKTYLRTLINDIVHNFPGQFKVKTKIKIGDFNSDPKTLSPLGIIINELLTNIMKYAFTGRDHGVITVSASLKGKLATVTVQDDGVGIPESVDIDSSTGFGLQLVSMLTEQLGGNIRIERGNGTKFILEFEV